MIAEISIVGFVEEILYEYGAEGTQFKEQLCHWNMCNMDNYLSKSINAHVNFRH